jgi:hypothetical protein
MQGDKNMAIRTSDPIQDARRAVALDTAWDLGVDVAAGDPLDCQTVLRVLSIVTGVPLRRLVAEMTEGANTAKALVGQEGAPRG